MTKLETISHMLSKYDAYIRERNKVSYEVEYLRSIVGRDPEREENYNRGYAVLRTSEENQLEYYEGYLEDLNETIAVLDRIKEEQEQRHRELRAQMRARRAINRGMTN